MVGKQQPQVAAPVNALQPGAVVSVITTVGFPEHFGEGLACDSPDRPSVRCPTALSSERE